MSDLLSTDRISFPLAGVLPTPSSEVEALELSEVEVLSAMNIFGQLLKKIKEEEVKLEGNNTSVMNGERIRSSRESKRMEKPRRIKREREGRI